jgi:uncharacterized protein YcfJ
MNTSGLTGLVFGVIAASAGASFAGFKLLNETGPAFAEVLAVDEVSTTVQIPRELCEDVPVTRQKPTQDPHRVAGTLAGAVIGGVLGNQIGSGSGKKVATVAGAAAGGYAGNKVQQNMQANNTYTTTERRCQTVTDSHQKVVGYEVRYRLGDAHGAVRMKHKPGDRIPVENGQLLVNAPRTSGS